VPSPPEGSEWRLVGDARQTLLLQDGRAALERTARFRIDDGQLVLLDGTGTEVLRLISTAATRPQEPTWS